MKREHLEDIACISKLLDFMKHRDCCRVTYIASMNSDKAYKSSIEEFVVSDTIGSSSESVFDSILDLMSDYDVNFEVK